MHGYEQCFILHLQYASCSVVYYCDTMEEAVKKFEDTEDRISAERRSPIINAAITEGYKLK